MLASLLHAYNYEKYALLLASIDSAPPSKEEGSQVKGHLAKPLPRRKKRKTIAKHRT